MIGNRPVPFGRERWVFIIRNTFITPEGTKTGVAVRYGDLPEWPGKTEDERRGMASVAYLRSDYSSELLLAVPASRWLGDIGEEKMEGLDHGTHQV